MELITGTEAAQRAGVSRSTITRWQANGELHAHARRQPSGQVTYLVDAAELAAYLADGHYFDKAPIVVNEQ